LLNFRKNPTGGVSIEMAEPIGAIPERIPLKSIDPKSHRPWSIDNIIGVKQGVKDRQLDMKRLGLVKVARNRFCHYFVNCHV
jgi:hypothetical protein